jgi:hypothetical protein
MSEQGNTSNLTALGSLLVVGRVSRVTLALLLNTRWQVSVREAHSSALARLTRAIDGLTSAALDYEQAELISAALYLPTATYQMWLTQCATIEGFLLASGENPREYSSCRIRIAATVRTLAGHDLFDAAEYTTKRERARALTRWALGDGNCKRDMELVRLSHNLWLQENVLRRGSART